MIKVILNIKNEDVKLTIEDARKLYNELELLFNVKPCSVPIVYPPVWPSEPIWPCRPIEPYYSPDAFGSGTKGPEFPIWAT